MDVRLIYDHIGHHAAHSGYDVLAKHVTARPWRPGILFKLAKQIPRRWQRRIPSDGANWYWSHAIPRDIAIAVRNATVPSRTIFHFLYPETDLRLTSRWKMRWNNKVMATFHQPPEFLEKHVIDKGYIRGLNAAVAVSRSQVEFLTALLSPERVFWLPHGVDVDYWCPSPDTARWDRPTFVFVGFWLRDVETAAATIRRAAAGGAVEARFRIVTFPDRRRLFESLPNTTLLSNLSDMQLRDEYRRAHALFLPLDLATANNVILEAMSCGTGIISTLTGGVPEYVDADSGLLSRPKNIEDTLGAVRSLIDSPILVERMGKAARARAESFAWPRIGKMQDELYRKVLAL